MKFNFTKFTAMLTALCFVFSFIVSQPLQAVLEKKRDIENFEKIFDSFVLPPTVGRVTKQHMANGAKQNGAETASHPSSSGCSTLVVNIQDLHCHPEVQRNISKIIQILDDKYHLKNVYVEGASGPVDTSWITSVKDEKLKEKILNALLDGGTLTGAEYYSALSNRPDLIIGVDDKELHTKNIIRLNTISSKQRFIHEKVEALDQDLNALKLRYYNAKNKGLENLILKHKANKISVKKYHTALLEFAGTLNIDTSRFSNFIEFSNTIDTTKGLNYKKIGTEMQGLLALLKQKLPYNAYSMLLAHTGNFSQPNQLYFYLTKIVKDYNPGLIANYPNLKKFFEYMEQTQNLNPLELIREEGKLINEIRFRLATAESERDIVFLIDFSRYLDDYLTYKISAEDYGYVQKGLERFQLLWAKYVGNDKLAAIEPYVAMLTEYYNVNIQRNDSLLLNCGIEQGTGNTVILSSAKDLGVQQADSSAALLPQNDTLQYSSQSDMLENAENVVVLITGGFHTEGVSELMKEKNIPYFIITPNVTQDTHFAEETYAELLKYQGDMLANSGDTDYVTASAGDAIKSLQLLLYSILGIKDQAAIAAGNLIRATGSVEEAQKVLNVLFPNKEEAVILEKEGEGMKLTTVYRDRVSGETRTDIREFDKDKHLVSKKLADVQSVASVEDAQEVTAAILEGIDDGIVGDVRKLKKDVNNAVKRSLQPVWQGNVIMAVLETVGAAVLYYFFGTSQLAWVGIVSAFIIAHPLIAITKLQYNYSRGYITREERNLGFRKAVLDGVTRAIPAIVIVWAPFASSYLSVAQAAVVSGILHTLYNLIAPRFGLPALNLAQSKITAEYIDNAEQYYLLRPQQVYAFTFEAVAERTLQIGEKSYTFFIRDGQLIFKTPKQVEYSITKGTSIRYRPTTEELYQELNLEISYLVDGTVTVMNMFRDQEGKDIRLIDVTSTAVMTADAATSKISERFKDDIAGFSTKERALYEQAKAIQGVRIGFDLEGTLTCNYPAKFLLMQNRPDLRIPLSDFKEIILRPGAKALLLGLLENNTVAIITSAPEKMARELMEHTLLNTLVQSGHIQVHFREDIERINAPRTEQSRVEPRDFKVPQDYAVDVLVDDSAESIIKKAGQLDSPIDLSGSVIECDMYHSSYDSGKKEVTTSLRNEWYKPVTGNEHRKDDLSKFDADVDNLLPVLEALKKHAKDSSSSLSSAVDSAPLGFGRIPQSIVAYYLGLPYIFAHELGHALVGILVGLGLPVEFEVLPVKREVYRDAAQFDHIGTSWRTAPHVTFSNPMNVLQTLIVAPMGWVGEIALGILSIGILNFGLNANFPIVAIFGALLIVSGIVDVLLSFGLFGEQNARASEQETLDWLRGVPDTLSDSELVALAWEAVRTGKGLRIVPNMYKKLNTPTAAVPSKNIHEVYSDFSKGKTNEGWENYSDTNGLGLKGLVKGDVYIIEQPNRLLIIKGDQGIVFTEGYIALSQGRTLQDMIEGRITRGLPVVGNALLGIDVNSSGNIILAVTSEAKDKLKEIFTAVEFIVPDEASNRNRAPSSDKAKIYTDATAGTFQEYRSDVVAIALQKGYIKAQNEDYVMKPLGVIVDIVKKELLDAAKLANKAQARIYGKGSAVDFTYQSVADELVRRGVIKPRTDSGVDYDFVSLYPLLETIQSEIISAESHENVPAVAEKAMEVRKDTHKITENLQKLADFHIGNLDSDTYVDRVCREFLEGKTGAEENVYPVALRQVVPFFFQNDAPGTVAPVVSKQDAQRVETLFEIMNMHTGAASRKEQFSKVVEIIMGWDILPAEVKAQFLANVLITQDWVSDITFNASAVNDFLGSINFGASGDSQEVKAAFSRYLVLAMGLHGKDNAAVFDFSSKWLRKFFGTFNYLYYYNKSGDGTLGYVFGRIQKYTPFDVFRIPKRIVFFKKIYSSEYAFFAPTERDEAYVDVDAGTNMAMAEMFRSLIFSAGKRIFARVLEFGKSEVHEARHLINFALMQQYMDFSLIEEWEDEYTAYLNEMMIVGQKRADLPLDKRWDEFCKTFGGEQELKRMLSDLSTEVHARGTRALLTNLSVRLKIPNNIAAFKEKISSDPAFYLQVVAEAKRLLKDFYNDKFGTNTEEVLLLDKDVSSIAPVSIVNPLDAASTTIAGGSAPTLNLLPKKWLARLPLGLQGPVELAMVAIETIVLAGAFSVVQGSFWLSVAITVVFVALHIWTDWQDGYRGFDLLKRFGLRLVAAGVVVFLPFWGLNVLGYSLAAQAIISFGLHGFYNSIVIPIAQAFGVNLPALMISTGDSLSNDEVQDRVIRLKMEIESAIESSGARITAVYLGGSLALSFLRPGIGAAKEDSDADILVISSEEDHDSFVSELQTNLGDFDIDVLFWDESKPFSRWISNFLKYSLPLYSDGYSAATAPGTINRGRWLLDGVRNGTWQGKIATSFYNTYNKAANNGAELKDIADKLNPRSPEETDFIIENMASWIESGLNAGITFLFMNVVLHGILRYVGVDAWVALVVSIGAIETFGYFYHLGFGLSHKTVYKYSEKTKHWEEITNRKEIKEAKKQLRDESYKMHAGYEKAAYAAVGLIWFAPMILTSSILYALFFLMAGYVAFKEAVAGSTQKHIAYQERAKASKETLPAAAKAAKITATTKPVWAKTPEERLNKLTAAEFHAQMRHAFASGEIEVETEYDDWNAAKTATQEKGLLIGGVLLLRKINGEWHFMLAKRGAIRAADRNDRFVAPVGKIAGKMNRDYENPEEIKELQRQGLLVEADMAQTGEGETVLGGSVREFYEETGIQLRASQLSGRVHQFHGEKQTSIVNLGIFIDDSQALDIPAPTGINEELEYVEWVPVSMLLRSTPGEVGGEVRKYLQEKHPGTDLMFGYEERAVRKFRDVIVKTLNNSPEGKAIADARNLLNYTQKINKVFIQQLRQQFLSVVEWLSRLRASITTFGSARSGEGTQDYEITRLMGRVAFRHYYKNGEGAETMPAARTGGGPAMMEAFLRGYYEAADEAGLPPEQIKKLIQGVRIKLTFEQASNKWLQKGTEIKVENFIPRKFGLYMNSKGLLVATGGLGTVEEFFEVLYRKQPIVFTAFWQPLIETMAQIGFVTKMEVQQDRHYTTYRTASGEIFALLNNDTEDAIEDGLDFIDQRSEIYPPIVPKKELINAALDEYESATERIKSWEEGTTFIGGQMMTQAETDKVVGMIQDMIAQGNVVRIANRELLQALHKKLSKNQYDALQAVIVMEKGERLEDFPVPLPKKSIILYNPINHQLVLYDNVKSFVFMPGNTETMRLWSALLVLMETAKMPVRPLVCLNTRTKTVGGKKWDWGAVSKTIEDIMFHNRKKAGTITTIFEGDTKKAFSANSIEEAKQLIVEGNEKYEGRSALIDFIQYKAPEIVEIIGLEGLVSLIRDTEFEITSRGPPVAITYKGRAQTPVISIHKDSLALLKEIRKGTVEEGSSTIPQAIKLVVAFAHIKKTSKANLTLNTIPADNYSGLYNRLITRKLALSAFVDYFMDASLGYYTRYLVFLSTLDKVTDGYPEETQAQLNQLREEMVNNGKRLIQIKNSNPEGIDTEKLSRRIHNVYLALALMIASEKAKSMGRLPVASVIFDLRTGDIVQEGFRQRFKDEIPLPMNAKEKDTDRHGASYRHAEQTAVFEAEKAGKSDWKNYGIAATMEPCLQCSDFISNRKFATAIYGSLDPSLHIMGQGNQKLKDTGIQLYEPISFLAKQAFDMLPPEATIENDSLQTLHLNWWEKLIFLATDWQHKHYQKTNRLFNKIIARITNPSPQRALFEMRDFFAQAQSKWLKVIYSFSRLQFVTKRFVTAMLVAANIMTAGAHMQVYTIDTNLAKAKQSTEFLVDKMGEVVDFNQDWRLVVLGDNEAVVSALLQEIDHYIGLKIKSDSKKFLSIKDTYRNNIIVIDNLNAETVTLKDYNGSALAQFDTKSNTPISSGAAKLNLFKFAGMPDKVAVPLETIGLGALFAYLDPTGLSGAAIWLAVTVGFAVLHIFTNDLPELLPQVHAGTMTGSEMRKIIIVRFAQRVAASLGVVFLPFVLAPVFSLGISPLFGVAVSTIISGLAHGLYDIFAGEYGWAKLNLGNSIKKTVNGLAGNPDTLVIAISRIVMPIAFLYLIPILFVALPNIVMPGIFGNVPGAGLIIPLMGKGFFAISNVLPIVVNLGIVLFVRYFGYFLIAQHVDRNQRNFVYAKGSFDNKQQEFMDLDQNGAWFIKTFKAYNTYKNASILTEEGRHLLAAVKDAVAGTRALTPYEFNAFFELVNYFKSIPKMNRKEIIKYFPQRYFKELDTSLISEFGKNVYDMLMNLDFMEGCDHVCEGCPTQDSAVKLSVPYPLIIMLSKALHHSSLTSAYDFHYSPLFYKDPSGALYRDVMKLFSWFRFPTVQPISVGGYFESNEKPKDVLDENLEALRDIDYVIMRISVHPSDFHFWKWRAAYARTHQSTEGRAQWIADKYIELYANLLDKTPPNVALRYTLYNMPEDLGDKELANEWKYINSKLKEFFKKRRIPPGTPPELVHEILSDKAFKNAMNKANDEERKVLSDRIWMKAKRPNFIISPSIVFVGGKLFFQLPPNFFERRENYDKEFLDKLKAGEIAPRIPLLSNIRSIFYFCKIIIADKGLYDSKRVYIEKMEKLIAEAYGSNNIFFLAQKYITLVARLAIAVLSGDDYKIVIMTALQSREVDAKEFYELWENITAGVPDLEGLQRTFYAPGTLEEILVKHRKPGVAPVFDRYKISTIRMLNPVASAVPVNNVTNLGFLKPFNLGGRALAFAPATSKGTLDTWRPKVDFMEKIGLLKLDRFEHRLNEEQIKQVAAAQYPEEPLTPELIRSMQIDRYISVQIAPKWEFFTGQVFRKDFATRHGYSENVTREIEEKNQWRKEFMFESYREDFKKTIVLLIGLFVLYVFVQVLPSDQTALMGIILKVLTGVVAGMYLVPPILIFISQHTDYNIDHPLHPMTTSLSVGRHLGYPLTANATQKAYVTIRRLVEAGDSPQEKAKKVLEGLLGHLFNVQGLVNINMNIGASYAKTINEHLPQLKADVEFLQGVRNGRPISGFEELKMVNDSTQMSIYYDRLIHDLQEEIRRLEELLSQSKGSMTTLATYDFWRPIIERRIKNGRIDLSRFKYRLTDEEIEAVIATRYPDRSVLPSPQSAAYQEFVENLNIARYIQVRIAPWWEVVTGQIFKKSFIDNHGYTGAQREKIIREHDAAQKKLYKRTIFNVSLWTVASLVSAGLFLTTSPDLLIGMFYSAQSIGMIIGIPFLALLACFITPLLQNAFEHWMYNIDNPTAPMTTSSWTRRDAGDGPFWNEFYRLEEAFNRSIGDRGALEALKGDIQRFSGTHSWNQIHGQEKRLLEDIERALRQLNQGSSAPSRLEEAAQTIKTIRNKMSSFGWVSEADEALRALDTIAKSPEGQELKRQISILEADLKLLRKTSLNLTSEATYEFWVPIVEKVVGGRIDELSFLEKLWLNNYQWDGQRGAKGLAALYKKSLQENEATYQGLNGFSLTRRFVEVEIAPEVEQLRSLLPGFVESHENTEQEVKPGKTDRQLRMEGFARMKEARGQAFRKAGGMERLIVSVVALAAGIVASMYGANPWLLSTAVLLTSVLLLKTPIQEALKANKAIHRSHNIDTPEAPLASVKVEEFWYNLLPMGGSYIALNYLTWTYVPFLYNQFIIAAAMMFLVAPAVSWVFANVFHAWQLETDDGGETVYSVPNTNPQNWYEEMRADQRKHQIFIRSNWMKFTFVLVGACLTPFHFSGSIFVDLIIKAFFAAFPSAFMHLGTNLSNSRKNFDATLFTGISYGFALGIIGLSGYFSYLGMIGSPLITRLGLDIPYGAAQTLSMGGVLSIVAIICLNILLFILDADLQDLKNEAREKGRKKQGDKQNRLTTQATYEFWAPIIKGDLANLSKAQQKANAERGEELRARWERSFEDTEENREKYQYSDTFRSNEQNLRRFISLEVAPQAEWWQVAFLPAWLFLNMHGLVQTNSERESRLFGIKRIRSNMWKAFRGNGGLLGTAVAVAVPTLLVTIVTLADRLLNISPAFIVSMMVLMVLFALAALSNAGIRGELSQAIDKLYVTPFAKAKEANIATHYDYNLKHKGSELITFGSILGYIFGIIIGAVVAIAIVQIVLSFNMSNPTYLFGIAAIVGVGMSILFGDAKDNKKSEAVLGKLFIGFMAGLIIFMIYGLGDYYGLWDKFTGLKQWIDNMKPAPGVETPIPGPVDVAPTPIPEIPVAPEVPASPGVGDAIGQWFNALGHKIITSVYFWGTILILLFTSPFTIGIWKEKSQSGKRKGVTEESEAVDPKVLGRLIALVNTINRGEIIPVAKQETTVLNTVTTGIPAVEKEAIAATVIYYNSRQVNDEAAQEVARLGLSGAFHIQAGDQWIVFIDRAERDHQIAKGHEFREIYIKSFLAKEWKEGVPVRFQGLLGTNVADAVNRAAHILASGHQIAGMKNWKTYRDSVYYRSQIDAITDPAALEKLVNEDRSIHQLLRGMYLPQLGLSDEAVVRVNGFEESIYQALRLKMAAGESAAKQANTFAVLKAFAAFIGTFKPWNFVKAIILQRWEKTSELSTTTYARVAANAQELDSMRNEFTMLTGRNMNALGFEASVFESVPETWLKLTGDAGIMPHIAITPALTLDVWAEKVSAKNGNIGIILHVQLPQGFSTELVSAANTLAMYEVLTNKVFGDQLLAMGLPSYGLAIPLTFNMIDAGQDMAVLQRGMDGEFYRSRGVAEETVKTLEKAKRMFEILNMMAIARGEDMRGKADMVISDAFFADADNMKTLESAYLKYLREKASEGVTVAKTPLAFYTNVAEQLEALRNTLRRQTNILDLFTMLKGQLSDWQGLPGSITLEGLFNPDGSLNGALLADPRFTAAAETSKAGAVWARLAGLFAAKGSSVKNYNQFKANLKDPNVLSFVNAQAQQLVVQYNRSIDITQCRERVIFLLWSMAQITNMEQVDGIRLRYTLETREQWDALQPLLKVLKPLNIESIEIELKNSTFLQELIPFVNQNAIPAGRITIAYLSNPALLGNAERQGMKVQESRSINNAKGKTRQNASLRIELAGADLQDVALNHEQYLEDAFDAGAAELVIPLDFPRRVADQSKLTTTIQIVERFIDLKKLTGRNPVAVNLAKGLALFGKGIKPVVPASDKDFVDTAFLLMHYRSLNTGDLAAKQKRFETVRNSIKARSFKTSEEQQQWALVLLALDDFEKLLAATPEAEKEAVYDNAMAYLKGVYMTVADASFVPQVDLENTQAKNALIIAILDYVSANGSLPDLDKGPSQELNQYGDAAARAQAYQKVLDGKTDELGLALEDFMKMMLLYGRLDKDIIDNTPMDVITDVALVQAIQIAG